MRSPSAIKRERLPIRFVLVPVTVVLLVAVSAVSLKVSHHADGTLPAAASKPQPKAVSMQYPIHSNIIATMFWVGEPATPDNQDITNTASAWVADWVGAFGGIDDPSHRCGYLPCGFVPHENPFYVALPFNDYNADGSLKPSSILSRIPWYTGPPATGQSLVKNHWIAITYQDRTAYGQWEDVGPLNEDDISYVFGNTPPHAHSGLDVSPALNDYLHLDGEAKVTWRFVNPSSVPYGPWQQTVTTSGLRR